MAKISDKKTRNAVAKRANGVCEYCRFPNRFSNVTFSVDHVFPTSKGGPDTIENYAWTCFQCNNHKQAAVEHTDPESGAKASLFNPRTQSWFGHFEWTNGYTNVAGTSPEGRATVERLKLNRQGLVGLRKLLVETGCHPDSS